MYFLGHVDDVRAIVQRAVKDLSIEKSLKTYEEVWLSKIFEMKEHTRNKQYINEKQLQQDGNVPVCVDIINYFILLEFKILVNICF